MTKLQAVVIFIGRSSRRVIVTVVGLALLAVGLVMMVTPGPGLLGIIAGLAVLATEYVWARRALAMARRRAKQARASVRERRQRRRVGPPGPPPPAA
jgi:uncharacterized protein (TIGR02611 family)